MNWFRKSPIRLQLSVLAFFIIVVMVFILFTNYFKMSDVIKEKNNDYFTEIISQINQTIASNSDMTKRLVQSVSYNSPIVQRYLNETDPAAKFAEFAQLKSYIADMVNMKDGILDIAIIGSDGSKFNMNGDINNIYTVKDEIPGKQLFYYTGVKKIPFNGYDKICFLVGAQIYSITNYENDQRIGTLLITIDAAALLGSKMELNKPNGTMVYMLDRNGRIFFTNDSSSTIGSEYKTDYSESPEGTDRIGGYMVQKGAIPDIGGEIIFKLPNKELLSGVDDIRRRQFLIFFLALLILAFPFLFAIRNIVQPLKQLMRFMNEIKLGKLNNLKKRIELQGYQEVMIVAHDFNGMLDKIDDLTQKLLENNARLYEAELVKKQSEMAYLQSQINPHFLYNTLESIKGLAVEEGVDKIFNMTKALATMFRYSIKGEDIIPLREELMIIKNYMYIQKIRFGQRLEISYSFDEEVLACFVPKMILQPIVENAIFHGIEPKIGNGLLALEGTIDGDKLVLCVRDDGVGMDKEEKDLLLQELVGRGLKRGTRGTLASVGLTNVNDRIKLYYGEEYGIQINSLAGIGTEVIIKLPIGGAFNVQSVYS